MTTKRKVQPFLGKPFTDFSVDAIAPAKRIKKTAREVAPGLALISADYSQIELRVMAHLSADPDFIAAFLAGEDIHRRTAMEILTQAVEYLEQQKENK